MNIKNVLVLVATLCAPICLYAMPAENTDKDLNVVCGRFVQSVLPQGEAATADVHASSAKYAEALKPDGSWPDIGYADSARSNWENGEHLNRLLVMAKAARTARNAGHADTALEAKIILALKWWTDHDYQNPNWWWNEIGVPELMGEIGTLLGPQLPDDQKAKMVVIMKRSDWHKLMVGASPWTGANLTWSTGIGIVRGCLEHDATPMDEGFKRMFEEIEIEPQPKDGMQQDYSFHQHGVQLYNGGYGLDFANDVGRFVSYSWGTRFQIPADRMKIFSAYLLEGEQWMIRGNTFDYSAVGREITRANKVVVPSDKTAGPVAPVGPAYSLGNVMAMLAAEPTPRQKELEAFAARLKGNPGAPEFTGNKQFWDSDFMTQRRGGYYTSVKMLSNRTQNGELVNNEGRKSMHLSDGANFLYLTGDEYTNVFAVWDWTKIPGTTAIQGTLETAEKDPIRAHGTTAFDGGVSDGTYGLAAMDLARGNLKAKKAWFFFDTDYVALGAGITLADDEQHGVATTVNQPLLKDDVQTSEGSVAEERNFDADHGIWVFHDHVGYIFAPHTKIHVFAGLQTGAWADFGTGSSDPVTTPVFKLWIDHGTAPKDASYEYVVAPGATSTAVARLAAHPDVEILANSPSLQGVYSKTLKLAEIAFRAAGSVDTPIGTVEVDHACLLLVREFEHGWKVTAANPENLPLTLGVKVKGKRATIELPVDLDAGKSVTAIVK